jgi:hypothetical protein
MQFRTSWKSWEIPSINNEIKKKKEEEEEENQLPTYEPDKVCQILKNL